MMNAYKMVMETGAPVKTAARQYGVPHNTLRDRVKGRGPLFSTEEEAKRVDHVKYMENLGYGFTITEVVAKATDYAVFLKKRTHDNPLSVKWFHGFRRRWPEIKCRAKSTTEQAKAGIYPLDRTAPSEPYVAADQSDVDSYFKAAESVIDKKKQYNKTSINKTLSSVVSGQEITRSDICQEIPLCEPPAPKKQPVPGPSTINLNLQSDSYSDDSDSDIADEDKCCVCKQFQPEKLKNCVSLVFTKWAQCDFNGCKHWTHLEYCCKQRCSRHIKLASHKVTNNNGDPAWVFVCGQAGEG
ncbi:hypothetical protein DPMN_107282 [Dreissena polymorpha]|uniref:HTH psq-type domain-containing protein n=1 Tax=Dreissena polymorpha TaxID=45954 RepID=A0A9D4K6V4_DREPO|nr:hypothetical protein DPMN_107282 [Dreissena polymorpha]